MDFHKCSTNLIELWIKCPVKEHICPTCHSSTSRVHDYYLRSFSHIMIGKRATKIYYNQRRYVCLHCGKRFAEKHYSNGITEGLNTKIKTLKRVSFGFRNFQNFRLRILMACS